MPTAWGLLYSYYPRLLAVMRVATLFKFVFREKFESAVQQGVPCLLRASQGKIRVTL